MAVPYFMVRKQAQESPPRSQQTNRKVNKELSYNTKIMIAYWFHQKDYNPKENTKGMENMMRKRLALR